MECYCRVLKFKFSGKPADEVIKLSGGMYKYFNSNKHRLNALNDFMDLQQYIYDKEMCKYCVNPSTIRILEGEVGRYSSDLVENPFSLDLHDFTYKPALEVVAKYLSLIEKHKIPTYRIIVGKSGNSMFKAVQACISGKGAHDVDGYNKDIFKKEITHNTYRSDGHYDFKFKGGDTTLWPVYDPYFYDDAYKERKDKYDKERAESAKRYAVQQAANTQTKTQAKTTQNGAQLSYSSQSQTPKTSSGGGFFAAIGGFFKAVAEGISEAAEAARRERERIARQQEKYDALYESKRGFISKGYSSIKSMYCGFHTIIFIMLMCSVFIGIPIWLFNFILDITVLNNMFTLIRHWLPIVMDTVVAHMLYILCFYGVTIILGSMIESHEKKKFYSMVPKDLHHEVQFRFF